MTALLLAATLSFPAGCLSEVARTASGSPGSDSMRVVIDTLRQIGQVESVAHGQERLSLPHDTRPAADLESLDGQAHRPSRGGYPGTLYRLSVAVLLSGAAADAASSWGRPELNPVLRDARGRFGTRGLVVKVSVTGGIAAVAHLVSRRHPRAASAVNFAVGSAWHGAAARNRRLQ